MGEAALLDRVDGHAQLRNGLRRVAEANGTWCGIPMPLEGEELVIEPSYPKAADLMRIGRPPLPEAGVAEESALKSTVRSQFYSSHKRGVVVIFTKPGGKVDWGMVRPTNPMDMVLRTLGCSEAWGIEQEANALNLLGTLVSHHAFKKYLLAGSFLETSKRSGVTYVFRKLRPTIALHVRDGSVQIMCALCMHPIGLYDGSWAGAMCPTDDVVAHLMLMRGDEALFWRRANQHPSWVPQSGLYA